MNTAPLQIPSGKEQVVQLLPAPTPETFGERRDRFIQPRVIVEGVGFLPLAQPLQNEQERLGRVRLLLNSEFQPNLERSIMNPQTPGKNQKQDGLHPASERDRKILEDRYQRTLAGITPEQQFVKTVGAGVATLFEFAPIQIFGLWGVGDVVTLLEAAIGYSVDLVKLTRRERLICLGAAIVPFFPARPIVAIARRFEERNYEKYRASHPPMQSV